MLTCVAQHIVSLPDDQLTRATLEDMALARAWYASHDSSPDERAFAESLPGRIESWAASEAPDEESSTEGRRQQPLIRALIDVADSDPKSLNASEWAILRSAHELAAESIRDFAKLIALLAPILDSELANGISPPEPGLSGGDDRVRILSGEDIRRTRPRKVRYFAGIDMPAFGPILSVPGDVKVLDSVPDETTLVVENGSCTVGAFVLGRIAARDTCEVRENVSGVVIVREGTIRARNAVSGAFVVSKWGSVHLRGANGPRLVFGGTRIKLAENANGGTFVSPAIVIDGEAASGSWSVSVALTAQRFRQTDQQPMDIALRPSITYEDYGGLISPEAGKMLNRLARMRRTESSYATMMKLARDECEHFASNAIMFLLGGDTLRQDIEAVTAKRRRIGFLDRIIAGIESAIASAEEQLREAERSKEGGTADTAPADSSGMDNLEEELGQIASEGAVGDDLAEEGKQLLQMAKRGRSGSPRVKSAAHLLQLREKNMHWSNERVALHGELEAAEKNIRASVGRSALLDSQQSDTSKVQILSKLLTAARQRPAGDALHERAKATFVVLMLKAIDARRKRLQRYAGMISEGRGEKNSLAEELENTHHIKPRPDSDSAKPAYTEGRFAAGIRICTDRYLLDEPTPPPGQLVHTKGSGERVVRYTRSGNVVVEEAR